jgi:hypothetical protein
MHYLPHLFLILFSTSLLAQDLHTFSNGEVADAEKINENFQYVLENATGSGGCSAEQDSSSVVITCADGTSGVLPGAGSVIVVEGSDGATPDISNIPLDFYVIDGNGDPVATFLSGAVPLDGASILIAGSPSLEAFLEVDTEAEEVILGSAYNTHLYWLHYTSEDCSGPAFITHPGQQWLIEISSGVYGRPTLQIRTYWKSRRKPGYFTYITTAYVPPSDVCESIDSISEAFLLQPYEPPQTLLNPTFPLTVDSLP